MLLGLVLSGCGGGGGDAGDVTTFTVNPSSITYGANPCSMAVVSGEVSVHTIIGGEQPFRVRSTISGLEVGLINATNQFVPTPMNQFLVLTGQDPAFAIRTTGLGCPSDVSVLVLDSFSRNVSVSIKVEESTN